MSGVAVFEGNRKKTAGNCFVNLVLPCVCLELSGKVAPLPPPPKKKQICPPPALPLADTLTSSSPTETHPPYLYSLYALPRPLNTRKKRHVHQAKHRPIPACNLRASGFFPYCCSSSKGKAEHPSMEFSQAIRSASKSRFIVTLSEP